MARVEKFSPFFCLFQNLFVILQSEQHDSASIQWGDCLRLWLRCRRLFFMPIEFQFPSYGTLVFPSYMAAA